MDKLQQMVFNIKINGLLEWLNTCIFADRTIQHLTYSHKSVQTFKVDLTNTVYNSQQQYIRLHIIVLWDKNDFTCSIDIVSSTV